MVVLHERRRHTRLGVAVALVTLEYEPTRVAVHARLDQEHTGKIGRLDLHEADLLPVGHGNGNKAGKGEWGKGKGEWRYLALP